MFFIFFSEAALFIDARSMTVWGVCSCVVFHASDSVCILLYLNLLISFIHLLNVITEQTNMLHFMSSNCSHGPLYSFCYSDLIDATYLCVYVCVCVCVCLCLCLCVCPPLLSLLPPHPLSVPFCLFLKSCMYNLSLQTGSAGRCGAWRGSSEASQLQQRICQHQSQ